MQPTRQEFEALKEIVMSLLRVEDVAFIKNIERRVNTGITNGAISAATSITEAVRNSADTGSESVAKNPDGKLAITLTDGTIKYIGVYNS